MQDLSNGRTTARVISMNVGAIREVEWHGRIVSTGIFKEPVAGRVALRGVNFAGDDQADRTVHGGPDKAVYAYSREDYEFWKERAGIEARAGLFGENLTVEGLDLSAAIIGERWTVGSAILEVAQIRLPCYKLGVRMGDPHFPQRFLEASRMGAYLRVIREGDVAAGDEIRVSDKPADGVSLGDMLAALNDRGKAESLLRAPRLPAFWRRVAMREWSE